MMAAIRDALARALRELSAARSVAGFARYRGVRLRHPGILVDQARAADAIDAAHAKLRDTGYSEGPIAATMARVTVRFVGRMDFDARLGANTVAALWTGGILDTGLVLVRGRGEWPALLSQALADLVMVELRDGGHVPAPRPGDAPQPQPAGATGRG